MLGTLSPPPRVSDPDMHHSTCMAHVPWCMPGSLTSGFLWSRWREKRSRHSQCMRNPKFYISGKRPIPNQYEYVKDVSHEIQFGFCKGLFVQAPVRYDIWFKINHALGFPQWKYRYNIWGYRHIHLNSNIHLKGAAHVYIVMYIWNRMCPWITSLHIDDRGNQVHGRPHCRTKDSYRFAMSAKS